MKKRDRNAIDFSRNEENKRKKGQALKGKSVKEKLNNAKYLINEKLKPWPIFVGYLLLLRLVTKTQTATVNDTSRMATIESLGKFQSFIFDKSHSIWTILFG